MFESMQSPKVELITIGREILDGRVVDTNAVKMAEALKTRGLIVRHAQRVDDDKISIIKAFELAQSRSQIVLVTGGLGPTSDDITLESLADFLGVRCSESTEALKLLEEFLKFRQRPMTPSQYKQCLIPEGTHVLPNPMGTACGVFAQTQSPHACQWAFMPGVPFEMIHMLQNEVLPRIPHDPHYKTYNWATHFIAEADLQELLEPLIQKNKNLEVSFRTRFPENHVGLHGSLPTPELHEQYNNLQNQISELLKTHTFSEGVELENIENVVLKLAQQTNTQIATVESCTGGLLAHKITSLAGSSQNFFGSWVTYHNQAKIDLGVSSASIQTHGAVSEVVASEMALSGLQKIKTHLGEKAPLLCVSTTGIAGPSGGSPEKPVGLCWIAVASQNVQGTAQVQTYKVQASKGWDRNRYQTYFVQKAFQELITQLKSFC